MDLNMTIDDPMNAAVRVDTNKPVQSSRIGSLPPGKLDI
jgi:hypothetical protein